MPIGFNIFFLALSGPKTLADRALGHSETEKIPEKSEYDNIHWSKLPS